MLSILPRLVGFYQSPGILESVYQRAGLESICKIRIINEKRRPTEQPAFVNLVSFLEKYYRVAA